MKRQKTAADISYFRAKYEAGEISFSQLSYFTHQKLSVGRFYRDEVGWENLLDIYRLYASFLTTQ